MKNFKTSLREDDKEPIDLTQKVLVRIFTNNSFESGGGFIEDGGKTFLRNIGSIFQLTERKQESLISRNLIQI